MTIRRGAKTIAKRLGLGNGASAVKERQTVFIISAPRSGSTWLQRALNQHPDIYCTENRLFGRYYDVVPNADESKTLRVTLDEYAHVVSGYYDYRALGMDRSKFQRALTQHLVTSMIDFAHAQSGKRVVVDKITPYRHTVDLVMSQIARFLPASRQIQLVRDGRDVLTSGVFDWIARTKREHPRYAAFVSRDTSVQLDRFFDDEDISQWADEWAQPIRAFVKLRSAHLTVRYEDMKEDQAAVLECIFKYLGLTSSPAVVKGCIEEASFKKMSKGRDAGEGVATAKVRKGVAGDWKNYFTIEDGLKFHRLAGDCLVQQGYVSDESWTNELPESLRQIPSGQKN